MSREEDETVGTGLSDVYDILDKTPHERVTSLTFQLGESPADIIIHAFCLIILRRQEQALNKLQMLGDSYLAKHLAGIFENTGDELDFRASLDVRESLLALARIFRVLSEQGLCEPGRRNLAYKRALKISEDLEYERLTEEAKEVCGPEIAASLKSFPDPNGSVVEGTLKVYGDSTGLSRDQALPFPLQEQDSSASYPTHLEISVPPTAILKERLFQERNTPVEPLRQPEPSDLTVSDNSKQRPSTDTTSARIVLPKTLSQPNSSVTDEEEEVMFYPFVILHAPEDADLAEAVKEKMETIIGIDGATFSEDFAIPGRSTLRCIEDAINNSAFTVLLLTGNFNTRMLEVKTDTALMNAIYNKHKFNTVIPLLPAENRLAKDRMHPVLRTLVPLEEEKKSFEKKLKKVFSPAKLKMQQRLWAEQQTTLLGYNQQKHLRQGGAQTPEHLVLPMWQQQPNIRIENANYIMIGNDSRMTVDHTRTSGNED